MIITPNLLARKVTIIFILAFLSNWVWEHLHSLLYVHYKNSSISEWVLTRSALIDASFIAGMAIFFLVVPLFRRHLSWSLVFGITASYLLERFALASGRWAYGPHMPIIPVLHTGLTPTIQIGLIAYALYCLVLREPKTSTSSGN